MQDNGLIYGVLLEVALIGTMIYGVKLKNKTLKYGSFFLATLILILTIITLVMRYRY